MRYLKIIVGVLVIIVGVIFVLQNKDLQRPIKLGFDPLYMFKSHGDAPPAPPAPVSTVQPAAKEETTAPAEGSATEEKAVEGDKAQTEAKPAPKAPVPAPSPQGDDKGIPAFILIFLAFFAGILVASLFGIMEKYRLKRVVKNGASRIRDLEEELKKIRNLPLTQPTTQAIITPPPSLAEPVKELEEPSSEEGREDKEEG